VNSNLSTLKKYAQTLSQYRASINKLVRTLKDNQSQQAIELMDRILQTKKNLKIDYILSDIKPLLEESHSGLNRVKTIVMDLKSFVRSDSAEGFKLTDLNQSMDSILNIVSSELKYKADIKKEYSQIPQVNCNSQQLGQVFINVLVNASQAMQKRGLITIRTYIKDEFVCVDIEDSGESIPEDAMDHIFDPFYTTKKVGQGTGLGLSISYDIIKKHRGQINVSSEVGKGTLFTIRLPKLGDAGLE
jgi:two-component system NtrC family sensor kinase